MIETELNLIKQELCNNLPYEIKDFGKLIRSKISLLLLKSIYKDITPDIINILCATELIHNASLLHDDIIDNEIIRRGCETINSKKGDKISLIYGNLTLTNAINKLLELKSEKIVSIFNNTIQSMCKGELLQQEGLNKIPAPEDYKKKTILKTAELFCAPLYAISTLIDIPNEFCLYAKTFGTAFQIKNDLDNFRTTKTDETQGIFTAPHIFGQEKGINGIEKTLSLIDNYIKEGVCYLKNIPDNIYKRELIRITECLKS